MNRRPLRKQGRRCVCVAPIGRSAPAGLLRRRQRRIEHSRTLDQLIRHRGGDRVRTRARPRADRLVRYRGAAHCGASGRRVGRRQRGIGLRFTHRLTRGPDHRRIRLIWRAHFRVRTKRGRVRRRQRRIELGRFPDEFVRFRRRALEHHRAPFQIVAFTLRALRGRRLHTRRIPGIDRCDGRGRSLLRLCGGLRRRRSRLRSRCSRLRLSQRLHSRLGRLLRSRHLRGGRSGLRLSRLRGGRGGLRLSRLRGGRSGLRLSHRLRGRRRRFRCGLLGRGRRSRRSWLLCNRRQSRRSLRDRTGRLRRIDTALRHLIVADAGIGARSLQGGVIHAGSRFIRCAVICLEQHHVRRACRTDKKPSEDHQNFTGIHHTCESFSDESSHHRRLPASIIRRKPAVGGPDEVGTGERYRKNETFSKGR